MPPELPPYPHTPTGFASARDPRSRWAAAALALALVAGMGWLMVTLGLVTLPTGPPAAHLLAVDMRTAQASGGHSPRPQPRHQSARPAQVAPQPTPPTAPRAVPNAPPAASFIHLSGQEFATADIGKMARPNASQSGDGADSTGAATYGPGEGPGGAHLYRAEWYRHPTDAQVDAYIQRAAPSGAWAEIACRTAEHHHVEDCEELDESPPGSGLSRALRNAAWQFLVRAPRINDHEQIGIWVRIRFDFVGHEAPDKAPPPGP